MIVVIEFRRKNLDLASSRTAVLYNNTVYKRKKNVCMCSHKTRKKDHHRESSHLGEKRKVIKYI